MSPTSPLPAWRRLLRHAITLAMIATFCAIAAPTVATLLLALQANGLTDQLPLALMVAPVAIMVAGPGVFVLGLVFGWMLLGLARMGIAGLAVRIGLAVLVASIAWWLGEPLPTDAATPATRAPGDWLVWAVSAAASALAFTRRWVDDRIAFAELAD